MRRTNSASSQMHHSAQPWSLKTSNRVKITFNSSIFMGPSSMGESSSHLEGDLLLGPFFYLYADGFTF